MESFGLHKINTNCIIPNVKPLLNKITSVLLSKEWKIGTESRTRLTPKSSAP